MIDAPKRKKNCPANLGMIQDQSPPLSIEFNEYGKPVGVNSNTYASFIGVITREHVSICIEN